MLQAVAQDKEIGQQRSTLAPGKLVFCGVPERFQAGTIGMWMPERESVYRGSGGLFATSAGNIR